MERLPTAEIEVDGRKKIVNADDPRATSTPTGSEAALPDRDSIAKMPKGEVREWLEAHGVDVAKGATVDEMRSQLIATIFVEV